MPRLSWNHSPYFDDFDSSKNFLKVLYKPGFPVQTRELNQIQSIFQDQIEKFGNSIFKNGSRISGANYQYSSKFYIRLEDISPWDSSSVDITKIQNGFKIIASSSGVKGIIVNSIDKTMSDPPTFYVIFQGIGNDGITSQFIPGEILNIFDSNGINIYSVTVKTDSNLEIPSIGKGTIFTIEDGIFYFEGMFIENLRQSIVVSKYGESPYFKIGFDFIQEIITNDDDLSLLDNVLYSSNSLAPGGDRFKISLILTKRTLNSEDGDNFICLAVVEDNSFIYLKTDSEYSNITDMIAKRTFETNGNYVIQPFRIKFIEDLAQSELDDRGYSVSGDSNYVRAVISGGIGYISGYRIQNNGDKFIKISKEVSDFGRADLLCVSKSGKIYVKNGIPSLTPIPPIVDKDAMALYEIYFKPHTSTTSDINIRYIVNKLYKMRDIGNLEERIQKVEYLTVLSLLEKQSNDMEITDSSGIEKYKNGFIADNFHDFQSCDIVSSDFKASLDRKRGELRPSFTVRNKNLEIVENESDCKIIGKIAMIDYDSIIGSKQPYGTNSISVNPFLGSQKVGQLILYPNIDTWADSIILPNITGNINTSVEFLMKVQDPFKLIGSNWGAWKDFNQTIEKNVLSTQIIPKDLVDVSKNVNLPKRINNTRKKIVSLNSRVDSYDTKDFVSDINLNPFMRPIEITFIGTKFIPNSLVYAFFNEKSISQWTRPIQGFPGDQLVTDSEGNISGIFSCPSGVFYSGNKLFKITSDKTNSTNSNLNFTQASAIFFSSGINFESNNTTLNLITSLSPPIQITSDESNKKDGVSQEFKFDEDRFITGIDLYFNQIDEKNDKNISLQIRLMENNFPSTVIISEKWINSSDIQKSISNDSSIPFHVDFSYPIFVKGGNKYCFVIESCSPSTKIWIAKLGETIINDPNKIVEKFPNLGNCFRSQNGNSWNIEPFQYIKYNLYVAQFKKNTMSVRFNNKNEIVSLSRDPFEGEAGNNSIRVYAPDHGLLPGDKTTISLFQDWIEVHISSGLIVIGMIIQNTSGTFKGIISNIKTDQVKTFIQIKNMIGSFKTGDLFTCQYLNNTLFDNYLINEIGFNKVNIIPLITNANGSFIGDNILTINGISVFDINKTHSVFATDSIDSFIIQLPSVATSTGRFGGEGNTISMNEKYETFNVSGSYLLYGSNENWFYSGIGHNPPNGVFDTSDYQPMKIKKITINDDYFLDQPHKISSEDNSTISGRKITIDGSFTTPNQWISPVINLDSFSINTISNRVDWSDLNQINVEPNSSGRFISESDPSNGSEKYKYITETVNLGNSAIDLVIVFNIYKNIDSDFSIWIKTLSSSEGIDIDIKRWMKVRGIDLSHNSSDLTDLIQYQLTLSDYQLDVYSDNINFITFNWNDIITNISAFKIKIVGRAKNPAHPPIIKNFRAIAVT